MRRRENEPGTKHGEKSPKLKWLVPPLKMELSEDRLELMLDILEDARLVLTVSRPRVPEVEPKGCAAHRRSVRMA